MLITLDLLVSLLVGAMAVVLFIGVTKFMHGSAQEEEFERELAEARRSEFEDDNNDVKQMGSWSQRWYDLAIKSGSIPASKEIPGRVALIVLLVGIGFGIMVWPGDILGGTAVAIMALAGYWLKLNGESKKRLKKMDAQLPRLLEGMRANLQAGNTPQQAILSVVDDIPSPLGDELKILRSEINVNVPLDRALRNLAFRVASRQMKFLVASIEIAVHSGSDLVPQLEIIQGIVAQRTRSSQRLATAVASVQPSVWAAGLAIPASFIWNIYSAPENRAFWFTFMGIIAFAVVVILYIAGLLISRLLVKGVENS